MMKSSRQAAVFACLCILPTREIISRIFVMRPQADATRRRREACDAYIARTVAGWRMPHRDAAQPDTSSPPALMRHHLTGGESENAEFQRQRDRQWAQYRDQLSQQWKSSGVTDPSAAARIERQRQSWTAERGET